VKRGFRSVCDGQPEGTTGGGGVLRSGVAPSQRSS
jgi:hypothetical protein